MHEGTGCNRFLPDGTPCRATAQVSLTRIGSKTFTVKGAIVMLNSGIPPFKNGDPIIPEWGNAPINDPGVSAGASRFKNGDPIIPEWGGPG